jgi:hypothetical protein
VVATYPQLVVCVPSSQLTPLQAVRNEDDLACMSVPDKYKAMGTFYKVRECAVRQSPSCLF